MMIWKTEYIEDLMLIYISLSITLREGGKFTINNAKRLFRLIELQPGEYFFWLLVESSFFAHMPSVQEPFVVFETVLCLSHYFWSSISSSQIFWRQTFFEKTIQASLYLICVINRLHDATEPLMKDILSLCPGLPIQQKRGYLEFCEMCVFRVVRLCCT